MFSMRWLIGVAVCLPLVGCGNSAPSAAPGPVGQGPVTVSGYSIKAYALKDGQRKLIKFAPSEATLPTASAAPKPAATTETAGTRPPPNSTEPDVLGKSQAALDINADPDSQSEVNLVNAAMAECIHQNDELPLQGVQSYYYSGLFGGGTFSPRLQDGFTFYAFNAVTEATWGCDTRLAAQELILCTADKLSEIADTVRPIEWASDHKVDNATAWEIPPQSSRDKFIARDLAINALAHIPLLDTDRDCIGSYSTYASSPNRTSSPNQEIAADLSGLFCDPIYGCNNPWRQALVAGVTVDASGTTHDVVPLVPAGNAKPTWGTAGTHSEARLQYRANIYRASGRLLKDLIDKSVEADMAGAEQQRANEGDPLSGAQLMWGVQDRGNGRYNSLRHALRVLVGRLERYDGEAAPIGGFLLGGSPGIYNNSPGGGHLLSSKDQRCNGFLAFEPNVGGVAQPDLLDAVTPFFGARWASRPPQTAGESFASSTLVQSGIVIHPSAEQTLGFDGERSLIRNQLLANAASERGLSVTDFLASAMGTAMGATFDSIAGADLSYAIRENYNTFRLLTGIAPETTDLETAASTSGLNLQTPGWSPTTDKTIVQIVGGLPRADLGVDITARLAAAQANSACPNRGALTTLVENQTPAFQNVFALGDIMRRMLTRIQSSTQKAATSFSLGGQSFDQLNATTQLAGLAATELSAWAGPVRVSMQFSRYASLPSIALVGLSSAPSVSQLAVAFGPPWVADCAAGLRKSCPAQLDVWTPVAGGTTDNGGLSGQTWYFGLATSAGLVTPAQQAKINAAAPSDFFYLVELPGGTIGGPASDTGRVLATFPNLTGRQYAAFDAPTLQVPATAEADEQVSSYQRDLLNRVFGVLDPIRRSRTCVEKEEPMASPDYCIEGMKRDLFVPLANELNSTGGVQEESWKHYLTQAQEAAKTADDLGNELIRVGTQQDMRREDAQEELSNACGLFAEAHSLTSSPSGQLDTSKVGADLQECMNEPRYDVVFLGEPPVDPENKLSQIDYIKQQYCTDKNGAPLAGAPAAICSKATFTFAGLGLSIPDAAATAGKACLADVTTLTQSTRLGANFDGSKLADLSNQTWSSQAGLRAALLKLRYYRTVDGEWWVDLGGERIMSTLGAITGSTDPAIKALNPNDLYPACTSSGKTCQGLGATLSDIFGPPPYAAAAGRVVESGLWNLGALAGDIPQNVFNIPIPLVNFNHPDGEDSITAAPALYSQGLFDNVGDEYRLKLGDEVSTADRALLRAKPMTAAFALAQQALGNEWHRELYKRATTLLATRPHSYLTTDASNAEITFNDQFLGVSGGTASHDSAQEWLNDFGTRLRGQPGFTSCQNASTNAMRSLWNSKFDGDGFRRTACSLSGDVNYGDWKADIFIEPIDDTTKVNKGVTDGGTTASSGLVFAASVDGPGPDGCK